MAVEPRLAATVLLLRNTVPSGIEVFMVRRVVQSEFMPDLYVFPGGSVSASDRLVEEIAGLCRPVSAPTSDPEHRTALGTGVRAAAIRELFEEGNILLASTHVNTPLAFDVETAPRFQEYRRALNTRTGSLVAMAQSEALILATDQLTYFAHWITPETLPKRFDTHFFLAHAPSEQEALYDELETSAGAWLSPQRAIDGHQDGTIPLAFATFYQLRELSEFSSVQEALLAASLRYVPTRRPQIAFKDNHPYAYLPETPHDLWRV